MPRRFNNANAAITGCALSNWLRRADWYRDQTEPLVLATLGDYVRLFAWNGRLYAIRYDDDRTSFDLQIYSPGNWGAPSGWFRSRNSTVINAWRERHHPRVDVDYRY